PPEHRVQDVRRPGDASRLFGVRGTRVFERLRLEATRFVRAVERRAFERFDGLFTTGERQQRRRQHCGGEQRFEVLASAEYSRDVHESLFSNRCAPLTGGHPRAKHWTIDVLGRFICTTGVGDRATPLAIFRRSSRGGHVERGAAWYKGSGGHEDVPRT